MNKEVEEMTRTKMVRTKMMGTTIEIRTRTRTTMVVGTLASVVVVMMTNKVKTTTTTTMLMKGKEDVGAMMMTVNVEEMRAIGRRKTRTVNRNVLPPPLPVEAPPPLVDEVDGTRIGCSGIAPGSARISGMRSTR